MKNDSRKAKLPVEQLAAGASFYAALGLEVGHFGPMWHLLKVGQMLDKDLNRICATHGLSIADFHLLGALMIVAPKPQRASDLALQLNVSNAALSLRVGRLAKVGYVERASLGADRRAVMLNITPTGEEKVIAIGQSLESDGRFVHYFHQLPERDRTFIAQIMGDLHIMLHRDFQPIKRQDR